MAGNLGNMKDIIARIDQARKYESWGSSEPEPSAAYLGPKLWDKHLSLQEFDEDVSSVMNIEEFLQENNIQTRRHFSSQNSPGLELEESTSLASSPRQHHGAPRHNEGPAQHETDGSRGNGVHTKVPKKMPPNNFNFIDQSHYYPGQCLQGYTNAHPPSYETRINKPVDEKRSCKKKPPSSPSVDVKFSPEDLALATVPGEEFDPKQRSFDIEELRPQPIIKKRSKIFVKENSKDDKYWEKRIKNNVAARRSREARRLKENQIALRAAFLEQENTRLRLALEESKFLNSKLMIERDILKQKMAKNDGSFTR